MSNGIHVIEDNWLLESTAHILSRSTDPLERDQYVAFVKGVPVVRSVSFGATGLKCLCIFLEHLVLSDHIHVRKGWSGSWLGLVDQMDSLYSRGIIQEFSDDSDKLVETRDLYERIVERDDSLVTLDDKAFNVPNYKKLIIDGSVTYLSTSDATGYPYSPHPIRSRFIEGSLHGLSGYHDTPLAHFNSIVDKSRLKLAQHIYNDNNITHLSYGLPPLSVFCLAQASSSTSPITIALQLRADKGFAALKGVLKELNASFYEQRVDDYLRLTNDLTASISSAEKLIKLKPLDESDGHSKLTFCGLPIKVPEMLRKPLFQAKHAIATSKLILTGATSIRQLAKDRLGLSDNRIFSDLLEFDA